MSRFSPRRLLSLAVVLVVLALPAVVSALTAAPCAVRFDGVCVG
jgi:hypothetical protein